MPTLNPFRRHFLTLRLDAGVFLETFLIAAITAVLALRFLLAAFHYPQLGSSSVHVSHMLWGGLGMMAAVVILLVSLSRLSAEISAVLGGLGFGVFIDELGKLLTADSDYFFRPSIALIYVIFVALFIAFRAIARSTQPSQQTYLVNAVEFAKEAVIRDLDVNEKRHALELLSHCDRDDAFVVALRDFLGRTDAIPAPSPHVVVQLRRAVHATYLRLVASTWFARVVVGGFVAAALVGLIRSIVNIEDLADISITTSAVSTTALGLSELGSLASSLISGVFALIGVWRMRESRLAAYRWFERSVLVSIFLEQVFLFYRDQLSAIVFLFLSVVVWATLRYIIKEEEGMSVRPEP